MCPRKEDIFYFLLNFKCLKLIASLGIMGSKEENKRKRIKVVASTFFAAIFIASIVVIGLIFSQQKETTIEQEWWKKATIYHIYVPSFKDSDGDGFGDLKGKRSQHFISYYHCGRY